MLHDDDRGVEVAYNWDDDDCDGPVPPPSSYYNTKTGEFYVHELWGDRAEYCKMDPDATKHSYVAVTVCNPEDVKKARAEGRIHGDLVPLEFNRPRLTCAVRGGDYEGPKEVSKTLNAHCEEMKRRGLYYLPLEGDE